MEFCHLPSTSDEERSNINVGFEIEYFLPVNNYISSFIKGEYKDGDEILVRVKKALDEKPEYAYSSNNRPTFLRVDEPENTIAILPTKIVAYTSGQNELLSNVFYKLKYHYFNCYNENQTDDVESLDKSRFIFLDQSANFSVFISNMLLSNEINLKQFKKVMAIQDLLSFRISINLQDYNSKAIYIQANIAVALEQLKDVQPLGLRNKLEKDVLILDFKINQATKDAFKYYFKKASQLFKVFYELEYLNLHMVQKTMRKNLLNQHKSFNFSDEMPQTEPSDLVFRIEQVVIDKIIDQENNVTKPIYYKGLSDGEHQFNEVIGSVLMMSEPGCLFLMDEPDTHFNPKWRAKLIDLLNHISVTNKSMNGHINEVRNQEIILTTHSPFVISDSYRQDVYKFRKGEYENPKLETYGASIGFIMEQIFDRDYSISDFSNKELEDLKRSIKSIDDIDRVKSELVRFGESIEKFDAYSYLRAKEKEFNQA